MKVSTLKLKARALVADYKDPWVAIREATATLRVDGNPLTKRERERLVKEIKKISGVTGDISSVKRLEIHAYPVAESKATYGKFICSEDVVELSRMILSKEDQEVFLVFVLDIKNRVLGYQEVARGAVNICPVDLKSIFRLAIMMGASALIIAHCHPSGDPEPSKEDMTLTERVSKGGELLGILMLDHLIVGQGGEYLSFAERGLLKKHTISS